MANERDSAWLEQQQQMRNGPQRGNEPPRKKMRTEETDDGPSNAPSNRPGEQAPAINAQNLENLLRSLSSRSLVSVALHTYGAGILL